MTLILSVFYLQASFNKFQYLGALVVFIGVFIEFIPYFTSNNHDSFGNASSKPFFVLTFCLGQLPASFSGVYQENAFSKTRVNVVYMMAYSSLAQFLFLVLFAPVNFIPYFGNTTPEDFIIMMNNAFLCITNNYDGHPECRDAGVVLFCCIISMLLTQIFQTLLVKVSSAATSVLVMTLITPVSSIAFTFQFLMGQHTEKINIIQAMALLLLLIGIGLYRFADIIILKWTGKNVYGNEIDTANLTLSVESLSEEAARQLSGGKGIPILNSSRSRAKSKPVLLPTRCGIINSEYTAGGFRKFDDWEGNIFIEATEYEFSRSYEERGTTPLLYDTMFSRSYDA